MIIALYQGTSVSAMVHLLSIVFFLGGILFTNAAVILEGNEGQNDVVQDKKTFVVEAGASPGKLGNLNDVAPAYSTVIFLDAAVGHDGKIGFWQYFARTNGRICFAVYDKKKDSQGNVTVESAGRNCITNEKAKGFTEVEIPPVQRLSVTPTSVVAIEYDKNDWPASECVISVESNMKTRKTLGVSLGSVMVLEQSDIRAGQFFPVKPYTVVVDGEPVELKALPSFKAIILSHSNNLDLRFGDNSRSGVAMLYMGQVWGTICDKWYHEKGWPYLFCAEKDFPDTEHIFYTDRPERFQVPNNTAIHLMNPRCKFSQNVTMFSCATHPNATCNHTNDVFIRCKSKVELRKGPTPSEGVCYVYESNYWGTICDKRDLNLINTQPNHWAHVCCRERGFQKAWQLKNASEVIVNENPSIAVNEAISMHSPVCMGSGVVNDIKFCHDGQLEFRCDHKDDIYVYCQ